MNEILHAGEMARLLSQTATIVEDVGHGATYEPPAREQLLGLAKHARVLLAVWDNRLDAQRTREPETT